MITHATTASLVPAAIPSPPREFSAFHLGPLTIHMYAICILIGIIAALILTQRRWKARGGNPELVWDVAIWAVPLGIIGGRLYHVFSSPDEYFGPNYDGTGDPIKILYIANGGLGIWGAVALGAVGVWIATRRAGVRFSTFADAAAPGVLLAQAIGRWGNYFNQELFGSPTELPWGLKIDADSPTFPAGMPADTLFHPTFLYESIWNILGVMVILLIDRTRHMRRGSILWLYIVIYTAGRTWIEALRIDEAQMVTIAGITQRLNVWVSILVFIGALIAFVIAYQRGKNTPEIDVDLPGRTPRAATAATSAGTDSGDTTDEAATASSEADKNTTT